MVGLVVRVGFGVGSDTFRCHVRCLLLAHSPRVMHVTGFHWIFIDEFYSLHSSYAVK